MTDNRSAPNPVPSIPSREAVEGGTSNEYIARVLHAAPFADNTSGIPQMCALIIALRNERRDLLAEVERLTKERDDALSAAGITHGVYPELYNLREQVADQVLRWRNGTERWRG